MFWLGRSFAFYYRHCEGGSVIWGRGFPPPLLRGASVPQLIECKSAPRTSRLLTTCRTVVTHLRWLRHSPLSSQCREQRDTLCRRGCTLSASAPSDLPLQAAICLKTVEIWQGRRNDWLCWGSQQMVPAIIQIQCCISRNLPLTHQPSDLSHWGAEDFDGTSDGEWKNLQF